MKNLISFLAVLFILGCTGETGPMGPAGTDGTDGVNGSPGTTMLNQYSGDCLNGTFFISVPEILNKQTTTYVLGYYSSDGSPDIWTPMTDGWLTPRAMQLWLSWTQGRVYVYDATNTYNYLIQVFEHN